jgi:hypothetical protein
MCSQIPLFLLLSTLNGQLKILFYMLQKAFYDDESTGKIGFVFIENINGKFSMTIHKSNCMDSHYKARQSASYIAVLPPTLAQDTICTLTLTGS